MVIEFIKSVEHNGPRKKYERMNVSDGVAKDMIARGIARKPKADPSKAGGQKPSALPPAQASQQTTAKKSKRGGRKRREDS